MKPKTSLCSFLAISGSALLLATHADANYYWDTNSTTSGLGNTAGTWGSSANWGALTAANSRSIVAGTFATANTTITSAHTVYFGTVNLALGSTASTIGITGVGVTVNRIVFGAGQGAQGVTLSGGVGAITLATAGASIVANNTGTNTIGAVLNGTVGLLKGGSGTVLLTGTNGLTGGVTLTGGGTLQVGDGTSGSLISQAVTFNNGGGLLNVRSLNAGSTQAMGALTFSTTGIGDGTVQSTYGTSGSAALTFSSLAARGAGATGNFVVSGGTNGSTNKIVLTGAATGTLLDKGLFFGGSSYAAYDATGYVRGLIYDGGTPDTNTEVTNTITASRHVRLTSSPAARTGDTLLSLSLSGAGVDYTMNAGSLTVPAILKSGGGAVSTISGGTSLTTAANEELVIRTDTSSDLLTISSAVTGFSGGLTKTGAGTLTLYGGNGYTGATRINAGILAVENGSAIVNTGAVILANAAGATLQLNSNETILNVTGGGFSGGNVNVQTNTLTLADAAGYTFGGTFTGTIAGGVIKQGAGTLILSNKNAFAGAITLEAGAVEFTYGNDGTGTLIPLSSGGAINMSNGTTLRFNAAVNLPAGVFGAQLQAVNGGSPAYPYGWTVANHINIASGTTTANIRVGGNENSVRFTGNVAGSSGTQTLAIFAGGIAVGAGDRQPNVFSGTIANGGGGTLGVNVDFAGASGTAQNVFVSLSGANTFTGPIVVTNSKGLTGVGTGGGYLGIGGEIHSVGPTFVPGTGYLGASGNYTNTIALAAGTKLTYLSSANQTLGGEISGAGALIKRGSGTLTLSTTNNYTGATTVSEGKLIISGSTSTTSLVTVASGATLGGTGTVGGNTTLNGILSPGTSPGTLTFTGNLTVNNLSTYIFEAGDLANVVGTLDLNDNWTLALGTGFQNGGTVMIFDYGTLAVSPDLVPTFDITNLGFTPSGALSLTDTGTSIVLNGVSVVPEPSTALLGGIGLLALLRRRRND